MKLISRSTEILTREILVVKLHDGAEVTCVDFLDSDGDIVETNSYRYSDGDEVTDAKLIEQLDDFVMATYAKG